ncbi:MAG: divergent polysaccharide deacetylase family protein [Patescibacteria group bacterium]
MNPMNRETRHLLALYLIFLLFLSATGVQDRPVAAGGGVLRRHVSPAPRLAPALGDALRRRGFVMIRRPYSLFPTARHRNTSSSITWRLETPEGRAAARLQEAATALALLARRHGAALLGSAWEYRGRDIYLMLHFGGEEGENCLLALAASPPARGPAAARPKAVLPALKPPRPQPARRRAKPGPSRPRVAIVLDDVGTLPGTEEFFALDIPLTVAILPFTRYAHAYTGRARAAGHDVILHLPLEARGGDDPGPGVLRGDWPDERIVAQFEADLAAVPGAVGVNNHMGSLGTADEDLMRLILAVLKQRGLFFLDSRTWPGSQAGRLARQAGLDCAERDVFLDPEGATVAEIHGLLRQLIRMAHARGRAVGICHANRPNTLKALRTFLPEFAAAGVELVTLTGFFH